MATIFEVCIYLEWESNIILGHGTTLQKAMDIGQAAWLADRCGLADIRIFEYLVDEYTPDNQIAQYDSEGMKLF